MENISLYTKKADILNLVFDRYKDYFKSGFHNILWQIMINDAFKGKVVVFYPVINEGGIELAIAHGMGGYYKSHVYFNDPVDFDRIDEIARDISKSVWRLEYTKVMDNEMYETIISESMYSNILK